MSSVNHYNQMGLTTTVEFKAYFNNRFLTDDWKIQLFMDFVAGHPHTELSNIKNEFLSPNMTSKLKPLDAGIIIQVKALYERRMLLNTLDQVKEDIPVSNEGKEFNIKPPSASSFPGVVSLM